MTLIRIGGLAALTCAATYLAGFALLVTVLAPLDYGTADIDPMAVAGFIDARPGLLIAWNSAIYVLNGLSLVVLVVALSKAQARATPGWAAVSRGFGLVWSTLVLGAGMIANIAVERAAHLHPTDPVAAADMWGTLHAVELGLGGGNEIAGAVWIGCASVAALIGRTFARPVAVLGLLTGAAGLATVVPPLGDAVGAVFGLGAIAWFMAVGVTLIASGGRGRVAAVA